MTQYQQATLVAHLGTLDVERYHVTGWRGHGTGRSTRPSRPRRFRATGITTSTWNPWELRAAQCARKGSPHSSRSRSWAPAAKERYWKELHWFNRTLPAYTMQKLICLNAVERIHVRWPFDTWFCRRASRCPGRDGIVVEVCRWGIPFLHPHHYDCGDAGKELLCLGHPTRRAPSRGIPRLWRAEQLEQLSSNKAKLFDALHVSHAESFGLCTSHSHPFWSGWARRPFGYSAHFLGGRCSVCRSSPHPVSVAWASNILQMLCLYDGSLDSDSARSDTFLSFVLTGDRLQWPGYVTLRSDWACRTRVAYENLPIHMSWLIILRLFLMMCFSAFAGWGVRVFANSNLKDSQQQTGHRAYKVWIYWFHWTHCSTFLFFSHLSVSALRGWSRQLELRCWLLPTSHWESWLDHASLWPCQFLWVALSFLNGRNILYAWDVERCSELTSPWCPTCHITLYVSAMFFGCIGLLGSVMTWMHLSHNMTAPVAQILKKKGSHNDSLELQKCIMSTQILHDAKDSPSCSRLKWKWSHVPCMDVSSQW